MTRRYAVAAWALLVILTSRGGTSQEQYSPLPDGWKNAKFGMSTKEVLSSYPNAAPGRDEAELSFKTYELTAPTAGVGRVTFFFFRDRLFKVAVNFDLSEVEQRFQMHLFEKKYGPFQEKDIDCRAAEQATKIVWHNHKHAIQLLQLVTTSGTKDLKQEQYLAVIYADLALEAEYDEYVKTAAPRKHSLGWDDF